VVVDEFQGGRRQGDQRTRVDAVDPHGFAAVAPQEGTDDLRVDVTGEAQHPAPGGVEQADDTARCRPVGGRERHGTSLAPGRPERPGSQGRGRDGA
jgi:hypothetical protein